MSSGPKHEPPTTFNTFFSLSYYLRNEIRPTETKIIYLLLNCGRLKNEPNFVIRGFISKRFHFVSGER